MIEARNAICAVSLSRISPIMMTSGSWRRMARSARGERLLAFSSTCTWLMPADLVLDRVLDRDDVLASTFWMWRERGVQQRRLARAGRAGDENDALRARRDQSLELLAARSG